MKLSLTVNGLRNTISYQGKDIQNIFSPIIERLIILQKQKNQRIIVFLSAPPAVGKSTLATFLTLLAKDKYNNDNFQAIGIDGFHYYNTYLLEHDLKNVKGAIHTFNKDKLKEVLIETTKKDTYWPIYDRNLHDPIEEAIYIDKDIIILEGNYLSHPLWDDLREYCDCSIFIRCEKEVVKDRLIQRKIQGGLTYEDALDFYEESDKKNVEEVLLNHNKCDIELSYDGQNYCFEK